MANDLDGSEVGGLYVGSFMFGLLGTLEKARGEVKIYLDEYDAAISSCPKRGRSRKGRFIS